MGALKHARDKPRALPFAKAWVDATGKLSQVAVVPTHEGARNGGVTKNGTVYLAHSQLGKLAGLVVVSPFQQLLYTIPAGHRSPGFARRLPYLPPIGSVPDMQRAAGKKLTG